MPDDDQKENEMSKADYNRKYKLTMGYKPVINVCDEELGLARSATGAAMLTVRLANLVTAGEPFTLKDVDVTEEATCWRV